MKNIFCNVSDLTNEAAVETWFINPLLKVLGYNATDIALKTSIQEFRIGRGNKSEIYRPDYIISIDKVPCLVIDAKAPSEQIKRWEHQCSSYCLELNKLFDYNPVQLFVLSNGLETSVYQWDHSEPILTVTFSQLTSGNPNYSKLYELLQRTTLKNNAAKLKAALEDTLFTFKKVSLGELSLQFQRIHQYIWKQEKKSPSAAFQELIKVIFVKIQKDRDLHESLGTHPIPRYKDVIFSSHWIAEQTENESPINDPLFKNLVKQLERDIQEGKKKRFFNQDEQINLHPETLKWIVKEIENVDFFGMEDDIHGRMFESFLEATARGPDLGQFFTPRDIVDLMVKLASIKVTKTHIDHVLDACCGSGGFLITAMNEMLKSIDNIAGLSNLQKERLKKETQNKSLYGIDAGSDPAIYRIARMNMYLHGDGGSNIFFADALDKTLGQVGQSGIEDTRQLVELRRKLLEENTKFDVILSNPPFSMKYVQDDNYQAKILSQYKMSYDTVEGKKLQSLPSSVMFLERYKDLVSEDGRILAIIDDSILSGQSYAHIRDFIRSNFIIEGIISLPGDAFKRAEARVKTSVLILRLRKLDEEQPDVFMATAVYVGLDEKIARRIGITKIDLPHEKRKEAESIITQFKQYESGIAGPYMIPASRLTDRLDVKFCIGDRGRKKSIWQAKGYEVTLLGKEVTVVKSRDTKVISGDAYQFLKVNYDGEVVDGEIIDGEQCSYSVLFAVKTWDILLSNMGVGRGAVAIVPPYHSGKFVSNEYTILNAKTKEEAVYYCNLLRTKEILGDILSTTTGMNRGRIKWDNIKNVEVPKYIKENVEIKQLVQDLEYLWDAYNKFYRSKEDHINRITDELEVNGEDAQRRWLSYKPPE